MYEEKELKYKTKPSKKIKITIPNIKKVKSKKNKNFINKINWKKLGIKLLILIISMIVIIFIISRINKNIKKDEIVINNNLNKIVDASIKFYTIETIPHNIGDSNSMLLDEMIQKDLTERIYDKQNNECNSYNSYIIITKITNEEYRLKAYLSCPKEEKTIEKDLICTINCQIKK